MAQPDLWMGEGTLPASFRVGTLPCLDEGSQGSTQAPHRAVIKRGEFRNDGFSLGRPDDYASIGIAYKRLELMVVLILAVTLSMAAMSGEAELIGVRPFKHGRGARSRRDKWLLFGRRPAHSPRWPLAIIPAWRAAAAPSAA
jgi:hypothetical protein